jgi:polyisoprenoid-binding protein YceI
MVWAAPALVAANPQEFDFKDPKGVNSIAFVLESVTEPIMGIAQGISGKITFDPQNPKSLSGTIGLEAKGVNCAHNGMTKVLHGEDWIDVQTYPTITFAFKEVKKVESPETNVFKLDVVGELTMKGVTKTMTVPVSATYLPGQLGNRMRGKNGDLLVLRSTFSVMRKDFNVKPDMGNQVVAEEIELRVSLVGGYETK